ncbi:MAG: hypothetical protein D6769_02200 [Methanobacteriota archaeon]|nr:MAG: hypothetical protein D6769_02200 [Euryarchaeota archaeon]
MELKILSHDVSHIFLKFFLEKISSSIDQDVMASILSDITKFAEEHLKHKKKDPEIIAEILASNLLPTFLSPLFIEHYIEDKEDARLHIKAAVRRNLAKKTLIYTGYGLELSYGD